MFVFNFFNLIGTAEILDKYSENFYKFLLYSTDVNQKIRNKIQLT